MSGEKHQEGVDSQEEIIIEMDSDDETDIDDREEGSWAADTDDEESGEDAELVAETELLDDEGAKPSFDGRLMEELLSLEAKVEAILFASPKPIKPSEIEELIGDENINSKDIIHAIDRLTEFFETRSGGFKLEYLKNLGYQFRTVTAAGPIMERMFSSRPRPLSRAAMETLAIIAYRQPATRAEIEFVRGVDAGSIMKNLLERDLIKCVGRKADAGRPMVFGTTDEFLRVFRLSSLEDLPGLDSFQTDPELIKAAMEKLESEEAVSVEGFIADGGSEVSEDELETLQNVDEIIIESVIDENSEIPSEIPDRDSFS